MNQEMYFIDEIREAIKNKMPEIRRGELSTEVSVDWDVNDQPIYRLVLVRGGAERDAAFRLNDLISDWKRGWTIPQIADELIRSYRTIPDMQSSMSEPPESGGAEAFAAALRDLCFPLTMRVVEIERNRKYLKKGPWLDLGNGFAATADFRVSQPGPDGIMMPGAVHVTSELMGMTGMTEEALLRELVRRAPLDDPAVLRPMGTCFIGREEPPNMLETGIVPKEEAAFYVLTTESMYWGASALFYEGVMEQIARIFGESYLILPSSLQEVLLLPESFEPDPRVLFATLDEMNEDESTSGIVLSSRIFLYQMGDSLYELDREACCAG